MNNKAKANAPKRVEVSTTKKQNSATFTSEFTPRSNRSSLSDNTTISLNRDVARNCFDDMPRQVQQLIHEIDLLEQAKGKCLISDLNTVWLDNYNYKQDASIVLAHYLSKFTNAYKGYTKEQLTIFNVK
mgnify:FL=1